MKSMSEIEDPLVMYIVVRESLNMSLGKTAIQCSHASQMLQLEHSKMCLEADSYIDHIYGSGFENIPKPLLDNIEIFDKWLKSSYRKVALRADEKEWEKLKQEDNGPMTIVVDAGLTELAPNTETVLGIWPRYKSQRSKLLKRLQKL